VKTLKARRRVRVRLAEEARFGGRVDRAAGVIRGVRVLGLVSDNGRRYDRAAVEAAIPLYEKKSVRTNHPKRATDSRDVGEVFGWLENVRLERGGLRADLHVLNPKSELAESVFLAAEKNPGLFGLSHNAEGLVRRGADGVDEVYEITEVRSVDLVADPATTRGLFEGATMRTKTRRARRPMGRRRLSFWEGVAKAAAAARRRRLREEEAPGDLAPPPDLDDRPHKSIRQAVAEAAFELVMVDGLSRAAREERFARLLDKLDDDGPEVEPGEDGDAVEEARRLLNLPAGGRRLTERRGGRARDELKRFLDSILVRR
jgi:hypothetical protein